jgi:geranylgeranyl pyrophosphate synthase
LAGVLCDTLGHAGSMIRAQLSWRIMSLLGTEARHARLVATAVEYFHAASLLFDDLPCMDDARERRGRPCPHLQFGQAATILGALALINRAYTMIWEASAGLDRERQRFAASLAESCLGAAGVLDGQSRDIHDHGHTRDEADVLAIAHGKTGSLFRLCMSLPACLANSDHHLIQQFDRLAEAWGPAYQIIDDIKDTRGSVLMTGKTAGRDAGLQRPNLVLATGYDRATTVLAQYLAEAEAVITELTCGSDEWSFLRRLQNRLHGEAEQFAPAISAA